MKVSVPNKWSEITLEMWQNYRKLNFENMTDVNIMKWTVNCFTQMPVEAIEKIGYHQLVKLYSTCVELLERQPSDVLKSIILIDGVKYGFNPDLMNMTVSEWAAIEQMNEDTEKNLHRLLSIYYRPITKERGKKYSIEDFNGITGDEFLSLDMDTVHAASFFFRSLERELYGITLRYMVKEERKKLHLRE